MRVTIIDYQAGNLHSAAKAFEKVAREGGVDAEIVVSGNPEDVLSADRVVLPGVGAFGDCYRGLASSEGMIAALDEAVLQKGRPFIGICVGMQLLAERGLEHGTHRGLGFIKGQVEAIKPADPALKIPHMGWNTLKVQRQHPLLEGIAPEWHAYFVHSYAFKTENPEDCAAVTDYGGEIAALVTRDNIAGSQFHPEKSQKLGLQLIANFLKWRP